MEYEHYIRFEDGYTSKHVNNI